MATVQKRIALFLVIEGLLVLIITALLFTTEPVYGSATFTAVSVVFMWCPALAVLLTRILSGDRRPLPLRLHLRKQWKSYLLAAFVPGAMVLLGSALYFALLPMHFDPTLSTLREMAGTSVAIPDLKMPEMLGFGVLLIFTAPLVLINHFLAFGEEIGWRGYLLPLLAEWGGLQRAILISGALWGLAHAPLVAFGLNYVGPYPGAPWSGMAMMMVFATVIGVFFSALTLQSESIFPASIAHGALNAVREAPLFIALPGVNALLGPKPSGLIGMTGFILLAIFCLYRLRKSVGHTKL